MPPRFIVNEPDIIRSKKLNEYTLEFSFEGKPDAGQVLWRGKALRQMRVSDIAGDSDIAATGSAAFAFSDDGVDIATITWGASGTVAVGNVTPNHIIAEGSVLKLTAPGSQDATLNRGTISITVFDG